MRNKKDRSLKRAEAAAVYGFSVATFDRDIAAGRGPRGYRVNGREKRFMLSEVLECKRRRFDPPAVASD
jgi:predicted DNA-binding transcriptional regulator AlpA